MSFQAVLLLWGAMLAASMLIIFAAAVRHRFAPVLESIPDTCIYAAHPGDCAIIEECVALVVRASLIYGSCFA